MTGFNEREKGFEAKFKQDQEFQFKVVARRNKLLGLWAADLMELAGEEAQSYAMDVVKADFEEPGDNDVLVKVLGDLTAKGLDMSEHRVRKHMEELMATASAQLRDDI